LNQSANRNPSQRKITPVLQILLVTFPFFALVLAGYVATRLRWLPQEAIPGLNAFVLYFALPAMLFRFGAGTPIVDLMDGAALGVYLLCQVVMVAFVLGISLGPRIGWKDGALGALVTSFPNTGFMGIPLLVALLGKAAAAPAIVCIVVDMVFTSSLCIALAQAGGHAGDTWGAARKALRSVLSNPMPWAIGLGALASSLQWQPVAPVQQTIGLLADAASPVALFTIGAVLARSQMQTASGQHAAIAWQDYVPLALVKLLVHPVLVLLVGASAIRLGLPLEPFSLMVMVLVAALPGASNVSMLAEKFGANNGRIARIILVSTALAFLSFSGFVALLQS
jgi:malonate transporter and related proteins